MGLRNVDLEDASPSIPLFSLASILSMLFLFLTLLSLSLSPFLLSLPYSKYVDIATDFSSREKKKKHANKSRWNNC